MSKEPEIPVRIVGMPQPPAEKEKAAVDPIAANLSRLRDRLRHFLARGRRQNLIRIQDQDPFVPKRQSLESPVLLFRPGAAEMKLHYLRSVSFRHGRGIISAPRIDH